MDCKANIVCNSSPSSLCSGCRLQFDTTLKKAVELAESIDKNGPDTPTDMQARAFLTAMLLASYTQH